jgi:hypothetical protein
MILETLLLYLVTALGLLVVLLEWEIEGVFVSGVVPVEMGVQIVDGVDGQHMFLLLVGSQSESEVET